MHRLPPPPHSVGGAVTVNIPPLIIPAPQADTQLDQLPAAKPVSITRGPSDTYCHLLHKGRAKAGPISTSERLSTLEPEDGATCRLPTGPSPRGSWSRLHRRPPTWRLLLLLPTALLLLLLLPRPALLLLLLLPAALLLLRRPALPLLLLLLLPCWWCGPHAARPLAAAGPASHVWRRYTP